MAPSTEAHSSYDRLHKLINIRKESTGFGLSAADHERIWQQWHLSSGQPDQRLNLEPVARMLVASLQRGGKLALPCTLTQFHTGSTESQSLTQLSEMKYSIYLHIGKVRLIIKPYMLKHTGHN